MVARGRTVRLNDHVRPALSAAKQVNIPCMARYTVSLLVAGNPFWCVDEEHKLQDWLDSGGPSRFTAPHAVPTVKTISMDSSTTALEIRWAALEAPTAWDAVSKATAMIARQFPDVVDPPLMRVEATLQTDADNRVAHRAERSRSRR